MEPLTLLATGVKIILTGALTRIGELSLDGAIAELKNLIATKSPDTLKRFKVFSRVSRVMGLTK